MLFELFTLQVPFIPFRWSVQPVFYNHLLHFQKMKCLSAVLCLLGMMSSVLVEGK
jgi:hypothetical protein